MKKAVLFLLFSLIISNVFAQKIEIGQDAERVKNIVEYVVNSNNRADSYGNRASSTAAYDVKYENGRITDVILCYSDQYLIDFKIIANYCRHHIMENNTLSYTLTQYKNLSIKALENAYQSAYGYQKIGDYYFSDDYTHYSRVYLHSNGLASIAWSTFNLDDLPSSTRSIINQRRQQVKKSKEAAALKEEQEKEKEIQIKSKVYDLKTTSPDLYERALKAQREKLKNYFFESLGRYNGTLKYANFPSFEELLEGKSRKQRFSNIYNICYLVEDNSRKTQVTGNVVIAGSNSTRQGAKAELISGDDKELKILKRGGIRIPILQVDGYNVSTEACFPNSKVDFCRGITEVRVKNEEVSFLNYEPDDDIKIKLIEKLKNSEKGRYIVKYEISNIINEEIINVELK